MVSVGGDGALLNSINIIRDSGVPVVGINIGRLGFLANVAKEHINTFIEKLLAEEIEFEERTLINLTTNGLSNLSFPYSLNDVVIRKITAGLMTVHSWCDDEYLNTYWADGLIVATPTGSSAYSMSVGGPIVAPQSRNFIISPIAAHSLSVRPLVIPDDVTLKFKVECREDNGRFALSLDWKTIECDIDTEIVLKRAEFKIKIAKLASFYTTLRNKLMWGVDKRN
jgi:NAD+ kinase